MGSCGMERHLTPWQLSILVGDDSKADVTMPPHSCHCTMPLDVHGLGPRV